MEARRFPDDYDGIIAGAPANAWTRLMTAFAWDWRAAHPGGVQLIPDAKLATIQTASPAACDGLDGVKDGLVNDPRLCKFDPATIACKGADGPDCLTAAQVEGLRQIYQGPKDPRTGKALFPGFPAGAEATPVSWTLWISGEKAQHGAFARSFFGDFVFNDANWKIDELDFSKDPAQADARMAAILNSDDPDLTAFKARGGKLILYHGWADAAITPYSTLQYYDAVRRTMGAEAADSFSRLYMVPGMAHCLGGPGPNTFDMLTALEGWSEKGEAPGAVIASKYANDFAGLLDVPPGLALRSRPLCAYPKTAHWTGAGSSDEAANWRCEAPPRADS
jgi:feruloyl esterase